MQKCAKGLKIKTFGASARLLPTFPSAAGRILAKMRIVETSPFQAEETEAERGQVAGPRPYSK